ncbi:MAG: hypothetical protein ACO3RV_04240 [Luteolibacter sp.]
MDKEQAKFILRSLRPNGADLDHEDFAAALSVAMQDRELGEWLLNERAHDAALAAALESLAVPPRLRAQVIAALDFHRNDFPVASDPRDAAMVGAMVTLQPPSTLRAEILAAMDRSCIQSDMDRKKRSVWRVALIPIAAAAGIALAFFSFQSGNRDPLAPPGLTLGKPVPVDVVQAGFIRTYESPLFSLDETREDHQALIRHLRQRQLRCPGGCLPDGVKSLKGVGCRELIIDGKRGSLICFEECGQGVVHLVVFRREDVAGDIPSPDHPDFDQMGHWAAARWGDDQRVFILIAATEVNKLASLF